MPRGKGRGVEEAFDTKNRAKLFSFHRGSTPSTPGRGELLFQYGTYVWYLGHVNAVGGCSPKKHIVWRGALHLRML